MSNLVFFPDNVNVTDIFEQFKDFFPDVTEIVDDTTLQVAALGLTFFALLGAGYYHINKPIPKNDLPATEPVPPAAHVQQDDSSLWGKLATLRWNRVPEEWKAAVDKIGGQGAPEGVLDELPPPTRLAPPTTPEGELPPPPLPALEIGGADEGASKATPRRRRSEGNNRAIPAEWQALFKKS